MSRNPLTPSDLAEIEATVRDAETRTAGEIFCVVAEESSDYHGTPIAWAAGVALLAPALLLLAGVQVTAPDTLLYGGWTASQVEGVGEATARAALIGTLLLQAILFIATLLIVSVRPVRLALTPPAMKRDQVRRQAQAQFLAKNLHTTRERTGVLIYVSFAEQMAELIADETIHAEVSDDTWVKAMAALTSGLKHGEALAGFKSAIGQCAAVLEKDFPARSDDNPNELSDQVVVLPRAE